MRTVFFMFAFLCGPGVLGACLDFYHVKRPVAFGAVNHEFIGALNVRTKVTEVFGLLKGSEDKNIFQQAILEDLDVAQLEFLGTACEENADRAVSIARSYAREWDEFYDNTLVFYARMGITPVVGKPCRNVALEIASRLSRFLH